jgi:hypothetical protein
MPEGVTETGIAVKFAPLRGDVSANAPEAKKPILKPFYGNAAVAFATGSGHHAESIGSGQDRRRL